MNEDRKIWIDIDLYKRLLEDQLKLDALDYMGVDNWDGWDDAMKLYWCWKEGGEDCEEQIW